MNYNHLKIKRSHDGMEWSKNTPKDILQYALGGVLYTPANHKTIADAICAKKYPDLKNIIFCLEDSILDEHLESAELELLESFKKINHALQEGIIEEKDLPLMFIRVRNAEQMGKIYTTLGETAELISGFALPKFDTRCMVGYCDMMRQINRTAKATKYMLPIIESAPIMHKDTRYTELYDIRNQLADVSEYVLNIRVGGNDFSNLFGLRRSITDTIYDVSLVRDVLIDILNVFGEDYVVSAPVWEYFGDADDLSWKEGLLRELDRDLLNGFIGKTAIHPVQLPIIQEAHMVDEREFQSAQAILQWDKSQSAVSKSTFVNRMDEKKVHERWAKKVLALGQIYGVKESNL